MAKDIEDKLNERTYSKTFYCGNCEKHFTKLFRFGEVAHKGACTHCGVSDDQIKRDRFRSDY